MAARLPLPRYETLLKMISSVLAVPDVANPSHLLSPFIYLQRISQITYLTALDVNVPRLSTVPTQLLYCTAWLISTDIAPEYASCFMYAIRSWLF